MIEGREKDREIVLGILAGKEESLSYFYRKYRPSLETFIKKRVSQDQDMEEILQDTLLDSIEGLRDFRFKSSLFTYVCSIANHKVIDYYRKKKIKSILFSTHPSLDSFFSTLTGPENQLDDALLRQKIEDTFRKLSPLYGKILKWKYIQGYSVCEIAGMLSVSFKSAESCLFRARRAFCTVFEP